jgi:hypothetical protein
VLSNHRQDFSFQGFSIRRYHGCLDALLLVLKTWAG